MITFFKNMFIGILVGVGAILPGISSGVILVSFGLYEKLLRSVLVFFKNIKDNLKLLMPIIIGIFLGVILFGNVLNLLYGSYPNITKFCFIGLILGTIPNVLGIANKNAKYFKLTNFLFSLISLIITVLMVTIEKNISSNEITTSQFNYFYLVISGFFMSIGIIVPGISSTVILMVLKVYPIYLLSVSTLNFTILFPIAIGAILGALVFMNLIKLCFNKFYSKTYYSILGFSVRLFDYTST